MRVIPKPHIAPIRAYIYCYSSFDSIVKQNQFKSISRFLNIKFIQYDIDAISQKANLGSGATLKNDLSVTFSGTKRVGDIHASPILEANGQLNNYF